MKLNTTRGEKTRLERTLKGNKGYNFSWDWKRDCTYIYREREREDKGWVSRLNNLWNKQGKTQEQRLYI